MNATRDSITGGTPGSVTSTNIGTRIRLKLPGLTYSGIPTNTGAFIIEGGSSDPIFAAYGTSAYNGIVFYNKYNFPNAAPSVTAGNKSFITWTGTGAATTPAMTRTNWNVTTATTDGDGDITITHNMPDATFAVTVTAEAQLPYITTVHSKGASTFKVRVFDTFSTVAIGTEVTINWIANDN